MDPHESLAGYGGVTEMVVIRYWADTRRVASEHERQLAVDAKVILAVAQFESRALGHRYAIPALGRKDASRTEPTVNAGDGGDQQLDPRWLGHGKLLAGRTAKRRRHQPRGPNPQRWPNHAAAVHDNKDIARVEAASEKTVLERSVGRH
jgi:hypothetical protein